MNWNKLYDRFYAKETVYEMLWESPVDMSADKVVGAPYGGPIAVIRDERKAQMVSSISTGDYTQSSGSRMRVFSTAGKLLSSFTWTHKDLVALAWNSDENLVCVLYTGQVILYSIHGVRMSSFELGTACREDKVAEAVIWDTGLVVRTGGNSQLFAVTDFHEPVPFRLADPGLTRPPTCLSVIPPAFTGMSSPEVLIGTSTGSILVVDRKEVQDMLVETAKGPFSRMVLSPDGTKIACFNDEGTLYILSTDFTKNISEFATKSKLSPKDITWCGNDAILLYWDKILLLVGFYGNFIKYTYDGPLRLIQECDGVRLISDSLCEFLYPVAISTNDVFNSGSIEPGGMLYEAYLAFEEKKVRADELMRELDVEGLVEEAVDSCLDAAMHEFSFKTQKKLLKAAYFGRLFATHYPVDQHVDQAKILRVLNSIRNYEIGIPLTFIQFQKLEMDVLINRLIYRHHHLLALRICTDMNISPGHVLVHWACAKVRASDDDDDATLANILLNKLANYPCVNFAEIAATAFNTGRRSLATKLLEHEPLASKQVPSLISMNEDEMAMMKAIESGDTDLVYIVLLHIKKNNDLKDIAKIIQNYPMAKSLFITMCKESELSTLNDYYYLTQQRIEAANAALLQSYRCSDYNSRYKLLSTAQHFFELSKTAAFSAKATEEQIMLMKAQHKLAKDYDDTSYLGASVSDIIVKLLVSRRLKEAINIKTTFKVPEKRFMHLRVRTAAEHNMDELRELSKNPGDIGIHPFIEACQDFGYDEEAVEFIKMIKHPLERMEWLCNAGCWMDATHVAVGERNREALEMIKMKCRQQNVVQYINQQFESGAV